MRFPPVFKKLSRAMSKWWKSIREAPHADYMVYGGMGFDPGSAWAMRYYMAGYPPKRVQDKSAPRPATGDASAA